MKIPKVTKLTLAVVVAVQLLNVEVASAKLPNKFVQTLKTSKVEALEDRYFQVQSMTIRELTDEEALEFNTTDRKRSVVSKSFNDPNIPPIPPSGGLDDLSVITSDGPVPSTRGTLDSIIMVIDKLIAIGQKIAPIIKEGTAVVSNNSMASVSVLPRSEAKDPVLHDMGGWSIPVSKHYKIAYKNGFGAEVVSFVYSITFQHSGSVNGKGKYLAGIRASARNITISWGFNLDANSQLLQISNVGTQNDIVAGATIEMSYTVKNWTRSIMTSTSFHVTGDGRLYKLD